MLLGELRRRPARAASTRARMRTGSRTTTATRRTSTHDARPRTHEHGHAHAEHGTTTTHAGRSPTSTATAPSATRTSRPRARRVTWRSLFLLGLAGGLIPSASALLLLLGTIAAGRPAWGVVLVAAFGVGMAGVMTGIGLALVFARERVERSSRPAPARHASRPRAARDRRPRPGARASCSRRQALAAARLG